MIPEFDEQLITTVPLKKYYTPKMIQVGTFLGGPILAGYFIGENYKSFGQHEKSGIAWLYSIIATAILFALIIFIPDNNHNNGSFRYIVPLLYSWAAFSLVKYLQADLINLHVGSGGVTYGWSRVILISLIGCAVTCTALFLMLITLATLFPSLQII